MQHPRVKRKLEPAHAVYGDLRRARALWPVPPALPGPLGHRCPHESFAAQREQDVEQGFRAWLETGEGRFAEYLAVKQRGS